MTEWIIKSKNRSYLDILLLLSFLFTALLFGRAYSVKSIRYLFLVWNLFLAWVPYCLALFIEKGTVKKAPIYWLMFSVWLLFFPNAPYMLTDLIHMPDIEFGPHAHVRLLQWVDVILITGFVCIGYWLGLESMKKVHKTLRAKFSNKLSWVFIGVISFLSGYAIFIGRYARLNSWDVVRPIKLIRIFLEQLSMTSIIFTIMFTCLISASYLIYYGLHSRQ